MIHTFKGTVKSVTANVAKKVVTVSFSKMPVTVAVRQSQMNFDVPTSEEEKGDD